MSLNLTVENVIYWLIRNKVVHISLIDTNLTSAEYRDLIKIWGNDRKNCIVLRVKDDKVIIEPETFSERAYDWDSESQEHLLGGIKAHLNRLNGWWTDPRFQELNSPEHRLTMLELGMKAKQIRERNE